MSMPEDTANYETGVESQFDFQRVSNLLHVVEKTRDYPKLKKIHDAAMAELELHANPPEPMDHFAEAEPAASEQTSGLKRNL